MVYKVLVTVLIIERVCLSSPYLFMKEVHIMTHIKLPTSFFDNDKLKAIRGASKDGNLIILLYTMLITVAAKSDAKGQLLLCDDIPYDAKILSGIVGIEDKIVKDGLDLLDSVHTS